MTRSGVPAALTRLLPRLLPVALAALLVGGVVAAVLLPESQETRTRQAADALVALGAREGVAVTRTGAAGGPCTPAGLLPGPVAAASGDGVRLGLVGTADPVAALDAVAAGLAACPDFSGVAREAETVRWLLTSADRSGVGVLAATGQCLVLVEDTADGTLIPLRDRADGLLAAMRDVFAERECTA